MAGVPSFEAMRADLVARGLLDARHRLTPAGHAHVDALIATLRDAEAVRAPAAARVRWNTRRNRHG